jgi:TolB-like protein
MACSRTTPPDDAEIRSSLAQILASPQFCNARRISRLLEFLVEKRLSNAQHDTMEYGVGIEVFDRDPASYSTVDDPIVRVQVGRLRAKLRTYYAEPEHVDKLVISIPLGNYMPVIQRSAVDAGRLESTHQLTFRPLANLSSELACTTFTQGLNEELSYQLFKQFGNKVVSHTFEQDSVVAAGRKLGAGMPRVASHRLEGSVRTGGALIRTSVRLIDTSAGVVAWSDQLDSSGVQGIVLQEELAKAISGGLKRYFLDG